MVFSREIKRFCTLGIIALLAGCAAPQRTLFRDDALQELRDKTENALCLPLLKFRIEQQDNTGKIDTTGVVDSVIIDAAAGLLTFETSQHFKLGACENDIDTAQSNNLFRNLGCFLAPSDPRFAAVAGSVRAIAAACSVDLVVIPYACAIKNITIQQKSWHESNSPGYAKPISFKAQTSIHLQVWNRDGKLIYERISKDDEGQPMLYSFLKQEKPSEDNVVQYAKRFYAPPIIRSLYKSIRLAFAFNR
jgi:hypothetical protein